MKNLLILFWWFALSALLVAVGAMMFFSPRRLRDLMDRLADMDRWSTRNPDFVRGKEIEARIGGLAMAAMGIGFIIVSVHALYTYGLPPAGPRRQAGPSGGESPFSWGAVVLSCSLVFFGGLLLLKPEIIVPWSKRILRHRLLLPGVVPSRTTLIVFRVIGAGLAALGISTLANMFR